MSTAAGFNHHERAFPLCEKVRYVASLEFYSLDLPGGYNDRIQLEDMFGDIHTDDGRLHLETSCASCRVRRTTVQPTVNALCYRAFTDPLPGDVSIHLTHRLTNTSTKRGSNCATLPPCISPIGQ